MSQTSWGTQKQKPTVAQSIEVKSSGGFIPPRGFVRRIHSALRWIDPADLKGIGFIFLFDDVPATTPGKNRELDEANREGLLLFAS